MWKIVKLIVLSLTLCSARVNISDFFPFGTQNGDQILPRGDDTYSSAQNLSITFPFFGVNNNVLWINVNGAISFKSPISTFTPSCQPVLADYSMVQPFWADVDTRFDNSSSTAIYYRQTTDINILNQFQQEIYKVFPSLNGTKITWAYVVTWYNVTYFRDDNDQTLRNTFQCVLGSNGLQSFSIFYYHQVQWTTGDASGGVNGLGGLPAQVGFDSGDGQNRYMLDVSCTQGVVNVADMSNVGPPGVFVFRIDSANIQTGSTYTALPTTQSYYQTTTTAPSFLSNFIGNQCSTNASNAWLDIVLLVDVSKSIGLNGLKKFSQQFATIIESITIGQSPKHSSRVAVIVFSTDVQVVYGFSNNTNNIDLYNILLGLKKYYKPDDDGGDVLNAFQTAKNIFNSQKSFRAGAVILAAAAYNTESFGNADKITNELKRDGVSIITIAVDNIHGVAPDLGNLSSAGFSYTSSEQELAARLDNALTQINCFCPKSTIQFRTYNDTTQRYTFYADCLRFFNNEANPELSEAGCDPGVLASVTSQAKLDFIIDNTINTTVYKNFTVGAYYDNGWKWYNYNQTNYPLGQFPVVPLCSSGNYGYFNRYSGFNWRFGVNSGGPENAMPYVCQYRACDADYFCV